MYIAMARLELFTVNKNTIYSVLLYKAGQHTRYVGLHVSATSDFIEATKP